MNCYSLFHASCAKRPPNLRILDDHKVQCCERSDMVMSAENREIQNIEIKYIKELLKETQDKNEVLKMNNELLIEKVRLLEEKIKDLTKKVENKSSYANVISRAQKTQTGTTIEEMSKLSNKSRGTTVEEMSKTSNKSTSINKNKHLSLMPTIVDKFAGATSIQKPIITINKPGMSQNYENDTEILQKDMQENDRDFFSVLSSDKQAREESKAVRMSGNERGVSDDYEGQWMSARKGKNKNMNRNICTGTKEIDKDIGFRRAPKKQWIYVGKIAGKEVTAETMIKYLKQSNDKYEFDVKKLNTKGNNSAFSIGVASKKFYSDICKPEFWPEGVLVRNFSFKNFFRRELGRPPNILKEVN